MDSQISFEAPRFDFASHGRQAVERYRAVQSRYEDLAQTVKELLRQCLSIAGIRVHSIEARAKRVDSFNRKAILPLETDPAKPKYQDPLTEITDLAGVRIITFFPRSVDQAERIIASEFEVLERSDKAAALLEQERFGYRSIHYLVKLSAKRRSLPEYARFADMVFEIQVRTLLQHAWAEIEHDIQYKSVETIPQAVRRRFMSLAGMLEIADREFQAIQDEDESLRRTARESVLAGQLQDVELTPDALKAYLDARLGPDGRVSEFSYQFTARVLRKMGFENLEQIDQAIAGYDDSAISRTIWGTRQGQLTRFEETLLAGMSEEYVLRHEWGSEPWFIRRSLDALHTLATADMRLGSYRPSPDVANGKRLVLRFAMNRIRGVESMDYSAVDRILLLLSERESKVLRLLYGFDGMQPLSLEEVSAILGIAPWQVRQVQYEALTKLEDVVAPAG